MPGLQFWPQLEPFGFEAVWQEIHRRRAQLGTSTAVDEDELDLAAPEWAAFTARGDANQEEFTTETVAAPEPARRYLACVVLGHRLREVSALYGFTRVDAPEFDAVATPDTKVAPVSSTPPTWVPCAEQRGEGVFLQFSEEAIAEWERRPAVRAAEEKLRDAHRRWRAARQLDPGGWPGARYVLLHTFAHALMREFALEAGYTAAGIAERVYARTGPDPMAGVLVYTAAPDSEGTLGGLVSLGAEPARLGALIEQALGSARLCSSDPLCAEHTTAERARLTGAACHACLFAAETSCERGNHYLDRGLAVDTIAAPGAGVGFFG